MLFPGIFREIEKGAIREKLEPLAANHAYLVILGEAPGAPGRFRLLPAASEALGVSEVPLYVGIAGGELALLLGERIDAKDITLSIETADGQRAEAYPPMAVTVTLADEIDVSRGDMLAPVNNLPRLGNEFEAMVVWMHDTPAREGQSYLIKQTTNVVPWVLGDVRYRLDVNELRKLAQSSDTIYLATDLDREGEAIAWHLKEAIGGDDERYRRVVFNEITKKAIQEAFEHPAHIDDNRVNAQQARRFLDRVVGYMVSPLLWAKVARGLSAGRVQSVAVRLIVEREREIRAFVPEEYWEIHANLATAAAEDIRFQVLKHKGEKFRPGSEEEAGVAVKALEAATYEVSAREDKPSRSRPPAPSRTGPGAGCRSSPACLQVQENPGCYRR